MEIYIEYALLENFLYDFILLWLAFLSARVKIRKWKLTLSACVGAVFAVLFPLLRLPGVLGTVLKVTMGALLCLLAFERIFTRKQWEKYLLTTVLFFAFGFGFGGTLWVVYGPLSMGEKIPSSLVFFGVIVLTALGIWLVKRLYARRAVFSRVYACTLCIGEKRVDSEGFYDSGNLATKNGLPVCFVSPALIYGLLGEEILKSEGQVFDEMQISTLAGRKSVPLCKGEIMVKTMVKTVSAHVYFAPSVHMIGREYAVLLNGQLMERERKNAVD